MCLLNKEQKSLKGPDAAEMFRLYKFDTRHIVWQKIKRDLLKLLCRDVQNKSSAQILKQLCAGLLVGCHSVTLVALKN